MTQINEKTNATERQNSLDVNLGDISHLEDVEVQDMYEQLPESKEFQRDVWNFIQQREQQRERQIIQDRVRESVDHTMNDEPMEQKQDANITNVVNHQQTNHMEQDQIVDEDLPRRVRKILRKRRVFEAPPAFKIQSVATQPTQSNHQTQSTQPITTTDDLMA